MEVIFQEIWARIVGFFCLIAMALILLNSFNIIINGKWSWFGTDKAAIRVGEVLLGLVERFVVWFFSLIWSFVVTICTGLWRHIFHPFLFWSGRKISSGGSWFWLSTQPSRQAVWNWVMADPYPIILMAFLIAVLIALAITLIVVLA